VDVTAQLGAIERTVSQRPGPDGEEVEEWTTVVRDSGTATSDEDDTAVEMSLAQFAPDTAGGPELN
jgi:hypothetical protein